MIHHKNNGYICEINAAAMVLGHTPAGIAQLLGHDGREVLYPEIQGPERMRGVHGQEIVDIAILMNIALVQRECKPEADHCGNLRLVYTRDIGDLIKPHERPAIVAGLNEQGHGHAIAYDPKYEYYLDPNGPVSNVPTIRPELAWIAFPL